MHGKGKKRQEQEGHALGDTRGIARPLDIFLSFFPTSLYAHLQTQDHPMSEVGEVVAGQEKGQLKIFKPLFA